jgi:hypothetical protein
MYYEIRGYLKKKIKLLSSPKIIWQFHVPLGNYEQKKNILIIFYCIKSSSQKFGRKKFEGAFLENFLMKLLYKVFELFVKNLNQILLTNFFIKKLSKKLFLTYWFH